MKRRYISGAQKRKQAMQKAKKLATYPKLTPFLETSLLSRSLDYNDIQIYEGHIVKQCLPIP